MKTKFVSGSVVAILMAAPLASPVQSKSSPKPVSPEVADARSEAMHDQLLQADREERQFPRASHVKEPAPPSPAPVVVAQQKPVSPYSVRVTPIVYRPQAMAPAVVYPGSKSNHFYYGYCTYYVATRRYIPWFGDAGSWAWNAVAYGFRIGYRPMVGAIWQIGNHVAYVEAVFADGSFRISEMNWYQYGGGFGRVDYRTLPAGSGGVFIY